MKSLHKNKNSPELFMFLYKQKKETIIVLNITPIFVTEIKRIVFLSATGSKTLIFTICYCTQRRMTCSQGDYEEIDLGELVKQILPLVSLKAGSFATSLSEGAVSPFFQISIIFFSLLLSLIPVVSLLMYPQTMSLEDNQPVKTTARSKLCISVAYWREKQLITPKLK